MSVRNRLAYAELMELVKAPGRKVHWRLEGSLLVKGQPVRYINIVSFYHLHQFHEQFYGNFKLTLKLDLVAYRHLVKYQNEIEFVLTKAEQGATGVVQTNARRYGHKFLAYLVDPIDPAVMAKMGTTTSNAGVNAQNSTAFEVEFELIEPVVRDFRMEQVGGVYSLGDKQLDVGKFLKVQMGYKLDKTMTEASLKAPDYMGIKGVDIVPPDNTRLYEHIVIPDGKNLAELPRFIQNTYGIYSSGLGFSIYLGWIFIFPLLDYTRFKLRERTMTILNVPEEEIPVMEKTFLYRSDQLYVFATGNSQHIDNVNRVQLNRGNGVRFSKAESLLNAELPFGRTSGNKTSFTRSDNMVEFIIDERKDKKVNARHAVQRFTDNPFKLASELSDGMGNLVKVQWDRSAPELLYPGMQVKFLYKDKEVISELQGVLLGVDSVTRTQTGALNDQHYITTSELTINVERQDLKVKE